MSWAGVDGCPGGWIAAVLDASGFLGWQWFADPAQLLELADTVCIDIPLGLPDTGRRAHESAVRKLLPGRGSSIFPTPVRAVLAEAPPHGSYERACALSRERCGGLAISRQTWLITDKIVDVDRVLSARPDADDIVAEAHPELAFATMNGGVPAAPKKTRDGARQRRDLVARWLGLDDAAMDELLAGKVGTARPDDRLDALACAWVAQRWARGTVVTHEDPDRPRDATGRAMRILC